MKLITPLLLITFLATATAVADQKTKKPASKKTSNATLWDSAAWEQNSEFKFWSAKPNAKPRLNKVVQQAASPTHSKKKCTAPCCAKK